jgi:hypothetical protein
MTAFLHCGHKTALEFSESGGRFVPKAVLTPDRLSGRRLRRLGVTIAYEKTFVQKIIIGFGIKK